MSANSYEISVAIPAYNRADYLKETLDSIFAQTYSPCEVIVVNDGSTDHTADVIASYGRRVKAIHIANSGAAVARKTAAEASTGNWLAFCDSDDLWLPHHLERRVGLIKKHPEIDFSFSDSISFGSASIKGKSIYTDAPEHWWNQFESVKNGDCLIIGKNAYVPFLTFNPAWPTTTVMSRDLYDKIGGIDPRYSRMVAEDADMTRKATLQGNVLCDLTVTAKQRRHSGNMSAQVLHNLLGKCQILENHIALNIAPEILHADILSAINEALQEAFVAAYYAQNKDEAKRIIAKLGWNNLSSKDKLRFLYLLIQRTAQ